MSEEAGAGLGWELGTIPDFEQGYWNVLMLPVYDASTALNGQHCGL